MTHADTFVLNVTGSCRTVSFDILANLLQALPDINIEGSGKLHIPHIGFDGHVAVMHLGHPREKHAIEFTFGGHFDGKPQILRLTVDSTFFGLDSAKRAEITTQLACPSYSHYRCLTF
jgi:hypothetical protein